MKTKRNVISVLLVLLDLILVIIDCKKEIALHRIVKYVDTGVLGQDITWKYNMLWLEMVDIRDLYLHIDKIVTIVLVAALIVCIFGMLLKKCIVLRAGLTINSLYFFVPFIYSLFYKGHGAHTVIVLRLGIYGWLMMFVMIVSWLAQFDLKKLTTAKPNIKVFERKNKDYTDEIKALSELYDAGAISKEEYEAKKKQLLGL